MNIAFLHTIFNSYCQMVWTYQNVEYVSLMDMYCDECLEFGPFDLGQIPGGLINKSVE